MDDAFRVSHREWRLLRAEDVARRTERPYPTGPGISPMSAVQGRAKSRMFPLPAPGCIGCSAPLTDLPAPARNGEIRPFPGGSRQGVRRFFKTSIRSGNLLKPRPHGSRAECVFVDLAVLHDHMKVLRRMRHELNVLKGISADNQKIGERALLDDAQPSGIRIAWTG
jgi:hypothetical protein